jgi:hypothetical protein
MKTASIDKEFDAAKTILHALEPFDEEQRRFILKTVTDRLGLPPAQGNNLGNGGASATGNVAQSSVTSNTGLLNGQTPKQFLKAKLPKTDVQRIACLAYYLTHARNQPHFKTGDLTQLNTDAGGIRMSNPSLAVSNATVQNGFLAPVGQGNKQITGLGEDVVVALPDQEAVKTALASQRKPRKKSAKKAAPKQK